jgi:hypothetical protein
MDLAMAVAQRLPGQFCGVVRQGRSIHAALADLPRDQESSRSGGQAEG